MSTGRTKPGPGEIQVTFVSSSIGKKVFMAVTGIFLILWITGHLVGNLQIFLGQDQLNSYAQGLKDLGGLLWVARLIMIIIISIHIWRGIQLFLENKKSRPIGYSSDKTVQASVASRTMIYTGAGILFYIIYHLLHFTFITTNPEFADLHDSLGRHDVYSMIILGFQNYLISGVYTLAMLFLFFHLSHGVSSLFQSLGLNKPSVQPKLKALGYAVASFFFLGFSSIPVAVLLDILKLPEGVH